jgi:hypothetical protein
MPWKTIDARSQKGIRVSFKNGKVEDFVHSGGLKFSAQVWQAEYLADKSDGQLSIGYWDSKGVWQTQASFPPGSYAFVRAIMN